MAKKVWDEPIDKNIPWDGNKHTDNLPVCGYRVEEFIKNQLNSRIGVLYYDVSNNIYLAFSDNIDRDEYLNDPTKVDLILATFDAPFNYTAEINLQTPAYNAVFLNSVGNYIEFDFDIKNKQGASTGENVIITYTFIRNANKQTITEIKKFGDRGRFNIDKYLSEGTNTIMVGITGQTTLAATTVAITYQVVNLTLSDELDISKCYDLSGGSQQVEIPFTVSGNGTKIVEWYIDGKLLDRIDVEDIVVDSSTTRTKYITLSDLKQGTHSLQIRAYVTINGENFYTDTLYRDLIIYTGANNNIIIGIATTIPKDYGIIGSNDKVAIYEMIQYIPYNFRFATYSPLNAASTEVIVMLDEETIGTIISKNNIENELIVTSKTSGNKTLKLISGEVTKEVSTSINKTSMNIREIEGAVIDFNASDKSNDSIDKNIWTDGVYTGTLTGFNWNNTSGWINGRLEMNAGASLSIDYAPLGNNPTKSGKTIEIEWSTKNVTNDNAEICDLRNDSGVGILITATKVSMISADGVVLETEYKSGENVRIGFIINRSEGITNKRLSFIYTNGIVSRAAQWASTDNYNSNKEIVFTATNEVEISLKSIKVYDTALSSDNMLNNFILYRDRVEEMMEIYDRNDVYEEGTTTFSPDKMMNRLPVMIVTGNIPILEETSKKDEEIVVNIEYYNMQDPSRSFTMKNAAMTPQGTSSMGYPKKNFRIYTQKRDDTILYDANNNIVKDKLYSFKEKAQPVNCWCLKADYAESSGTHNTGIARLWNKALYEARIDGEYKLRTEAQKRAIENNYNYDVRTTIDGFPILLFYRLQENDDLIFIGKYNFNNDKSTEKVFGFTDIPGFNNDNMQCWEILHNGNALALFTSADNFDTDWSKAFEGRYPDKNTKTEHLEAFCKWMAGVDTERFASEKWEHLDIYKIAAYWSYLMRFAAADQFVKNAMLTSEDGKIWYFILYDNDTINGLINTGHLKIKPTDDRQTKDSSDEYVFAGHDSKLWNMLEADEEFMQIVSKVDDALYTAGISYAKTIKIFDEEQADKWVEKVYNQDAQYKYIGPYVDKGTNNLFMLQGKRDLHRKWWLAKRFSIYDAKYVSGAYKAKNIEVKCTNDTPKESQFSITSGYPLDYGYGINNVVHASGITLNVGESHTFTTPSNATLYRGDPISIYGAPNLAEVDFSKMSEYLATINVTNVYDDNLGTKLTKLVLGNPSKTNGALSEISGLKQAIALEELDIQGMSMMISVDLSNHQYFKRLKASGSGLASVSFTKGAPVEYLELPASMRTLSLEQLPYLTGDNVSVANYMANVSTIIIKECPNITNNFNFVKRWLINHSIAEDKELTLIMDNVNWTDVSPADLVRVGQLGTISLKGKVRLTEISDEYINILSNLFGDTAFDKNSEFYIDAPPSLYIQGPATILEGESATYKMLLFGGELKGNPIWSVNQYVSGIDFNTETQYLTTTETGVNRSITLVLVVVTTDNEAVTTELTVSVKARIYPSSNYTNIIGDSRLGESGEIAKEENVLGGSIYKLEMTNGVNGEYYVEWSLSGLEEYTFTKLIPVDKNYYIIGITSYPSTPVTGTITASLYKKSTNKFLFNKTKTIELINEDIAETDPGICAALYAKKIIANESYITKDEALSISADVLQPGTSSNTSIFASYTGQIKSFKGFKYFTNVKKIKPDTFRGCTSLTSIAIPDSVTEIGDYAFRDCSSLKSITIPDKIERIGSSAFYGCSGLTNTIIGNSVTYIGYSAFHGCSSLTNVTIPDSVTTIESNTFNGCSSLKSVRLSNNITSISNALFQSCRALTSITIPNSVTSIGTIAFDGCTSLTSITIPNGVTSIGDQAFLSCNSLTSVTIPDSVTQIGYGAFASCFSIESFKGKFAADNGRCLIRVNDGVLIAFAYNCGDTEYSILNGITKIERLAFRGCDLTSITIPDSVTSIGDDAFSQCRSLTTINIPNSVTTIGYGAFAYCDNLANITISNNLKEIKYQTFNWCISLEQIIIGDNVTIIGESAFYKCDNLKNVTIGKGITKIGAAAFENCKNLNIITCKALTAPTVSSNTFGSSTLNYTGCNTLDQNVLYVPAVNSTGYETGYWSDPLCHEDKCRFTLSKTLIM